MGIEYEKLKSCDFLTLYVNEKPQLFEQILRLTCLAMASDRRDKIYKPEYPHKVNLDKLLGNDYLEGISEIRKKIEMAKSDRDLPYAEDEYNFLCFSLYATPLQIDRVDNSISKDLVQYNIVNPNQEEFDRQKEKTGSTLLYHGSPTENWYSIVKNGLVVASNTSLMLNGATYGKGIYLTDSFQFALAYSIKHNQTLVKTNPETILGVFEVLGAKQQYHQSGNIYVVPDPSKVTIKYLFAFRQGISMFDISKAAAPLDKYVQITSNGIETVHQSICKRVHNRRLLADYNRALRLRDGVVMLPKSGNSIDEWYVYLGDFGQDEPLTQDMAKYGIDAIKCEIRFPDRYPIDPPFVRIVSPKFQSLTGHITSGGSICMELLTSSGWSPVVSIETLFIHIKSQILEGKARIDPQTLGQEYTHQQAIESFKRVAIQHGWIR
jgi:ubiquitin-protein ligase